MTITHPINEFQEAMKREYARARLVHNPMNSLHEGLAVLWEEFEELKTEVFKKHPDRNDIQHELVQVATMAMAMMLEVVNQ